MNTTKTTTAAGRRLLNPIPLDEVMRTVRRDRNVRTLEQHGADYRILAGRVLVQTGAETWTDCGEWTTPKLLNWLGY